MDTRLIELLPRAMNMRNGDIKSDQKMPAPSYRNPFGSVMRSFARGDLRIARLGSCRDRPLRLRHDGP